ncbi:MAG TPA: alpha/beta hydrolase [Candidatus Dormibacteraeota bacterium]
MTRRLAPLLVIVAIVLAACTRNPIASTHSSPPPPSPGKVAWTDCGGGFQCGTLQVPLDYAHPTVRTIGIALIRKVATDPSSRIGSVLTNPGGPGASGIEFLRGEAASMTTLNRSFDLVGFDPRGVGQSSPVRCLTGPQEDAYLALDSVLDDPAEKQAAIAADKSYAAACDARNHDLLPFIDTVDVARDMDLIRESLGDSKLTYLGFSYGTYIGQIYAHMFPTHIRALSLDGVVDPAVSANDAILAQVKGFEQNLQAFLADCRVRAGCAYGRSGDPGVKLTALMTRLDATPMIVGTRQLTRSLAMTGVLLALYDQSSWQYLDQALTNADKGDGRVLLFLADIYNNRNADGTYKNDLDAMSATYCLDHPVPQDLAAYDALGPSFAQASPLFGPWIQYGNVTCIYWPAKPTGQDAPIDVSGAPPILLVGGTDDPATPYAWSQAVNQQIAGSVLLTRRGNGHTSYDASKCAHAAEDAYLISLTLPAAGTVCTS